MCEYVSAGDFNFIGRLSSSLWRFFLYNSLLALVFTMFLIYLWSQAAFSRYRSFYNLSSDSFIGFFIALSNAYGLLHIIVFLGYGIVSVP